MDDVQSLRTQDSSHTTNDEHGIQLEQSPEDPDVSLDLLAALKLPTSPREVSEVTGDSATHEDEVPVVQITEPSSPTPHLEDSPTQSSSTPPLSPSGRSAHRAAAANSLSAGPVSERHRHRSTAEARAGNRLSGFFTNLIHRRDTMQPPTPRSATTPTHRDQTPSVNSPSNPPSRAESPMPLRSITPPPPLPAPTLTELGLFLSVLTSNLSPSHFSTPPTSGAFLAPHYLLLCHAQGLDVLPLVSPPASQPFSLIRRVSFKSVVVMEQRGVLVAIAGRRDGVRVYALEEVKKAVEWRMEMESRRERERIRRDAHKKGPAHGLLLGGAHERPSSSSSDKTPPIPAMPVRGKPARKSSTSSAPPLPPITIPTTVPTLRKPKTPPSLQAPVPVPTGNPPPYSAEDIQVQPRLRSQNSMVELVAPSRPRRNSVNNVLVGSGRSRRNTIVAAANQEHDPDSKADWSEARDSDDEAINVVAAGSSGSQALDERTSNRHSVVPPVPPLPTDVTTPPIAQRSPNGVSSVRRNRPANLDLSLALSNPTSAPAPEPSPAPTLINLRRTLSHAPEALPATFDPETPVEADDIEPEDGDGDGDVDGDDEGARTPHADNHITLAQALLESRIPELPPPGTRRAQQSVIVASPTRASFASEATSIASSMGGSVSERTERSRRRRWSVLDGVFSNITSTTPNVSSGSTPTPPSGPSSVRNVARSASTAAGMTERNTPPSPTRNRITRSQSFRTGHASSSTSNVRSASQSNITTTTLVLPPPAPPSTSHSRFIPRIISNAFHSRRSEDQPQALVIKTSDPDISRRSGTPTSTQAPPPKLEYVKLPGTKGALLVKAVETAKKSFLAILCGENGEKVELFAGTYRTALGLSRTFILPDSPRSLELQLQGDDLVEVFLVFSQNVFGLEPATVRVREVRIGRAERRAARRRAREIRTGETANDSDHPAGNEDTNVDVDIQIVSQAASTEDGTGDNTGSHTPTESALLPPAPIDEPSTPLGGSETPVVATAHQAALNTAADEIVAAATAQMGPYTTFQQLSFAPNFPLASIADEYIIPPTYPDFLDYRGTHESEGDGVNVVDLASVQFSPPGLPVPGPSAPCKWFYRDPKGVVHGPWKASLMHAWYKDGLLPPDLPVRREEDEEYLLLKDLRLQSVDPTHPFKTPAAPQLVPQPLALLPDSGARLLSPISLLSQPKHFGPPALFFSSRGGHSTAIVDARGRSVLKGRFVWSGDERDDDSKSLGRMGDVKRLEAFDVRDRSVIVAMRQGGLEAMDLGDALLRPGDDSRTVLPQFDPPVSGTNRRGPFVWKIGMPVSSSGSTSTVLASARKSSYIPGKKSSVGPGKSPGKPDFTPGGDADSENHDEVLFLGRKENEIYICERNAGSFRILRLGLNNHV